MCKCAEEFELKYPCSLQLNKDDVTDEDKDVDNDVGDDKVVENHVGDDEMPLPSDGIVSIVAIVVNEDKNVDNHVGDDEVPLPSGGSSLLA